MRRLIIAHETSDQLGGSAHLFWVRLIPDGLALASAITYQVRWGLTGIPLPLMGDSVALFHKIFPSAVDLARLVLT